MASSELTGAPHDELAELPALGVLPPDVRDLVAASFQPIGYRFGETIVAAGDPADAFYVVCSGIARVVGCGDDGKEVSLGLLRPGDSFGETGLLDGAPRTATVRAAADVRALRLDAPVFRALVRLHPGVGEAFELQARARRLAGFLAVHSAFSCLPTKAILPLLQDLDTVDLAVGEAAVREGEPADCLFIVERGRLHALTGAGDVRRDVRYLRSGDLFGERSLYLDEPRRATVEALESCRLLRLRRATFARLMDEHPAFRARVADLVRSYRLDRAAPVPLDFADLLPAAAVEAALAERPPAELVGAVPDLPAAGSATRRAPAHRRLRRPSFPLVRQLDEMDCGAACVAMVCRHFGRPVAASHIRMAIGTGADGTSLRGLQRGGEHVGLEVRAVKASKDRLNDLPLPAIVHWGGNHWVVLYALEGERAYVADPARGRRRVPVADLMEQWSGYAALPAATPALAKAPLGTANAGWLWALIKPHRRALLVGVVLAFVAAGLEMLFPVLTQQ
ncbi:MAG: cyclic nucleotide-binding domain-containing protein, partial [Solirubrobacteraceae bacterium]